jgi:NADH:ubiquinone oxidoreductase subunit 6 (subunit J)
MGATAFGIAVLIVTLIVVFLTASAYVSIVPLLNHEAGPDENLETVARTDYVPYTAALAVALVVLLFAVFALYLSGAPSTGVPGQYAAIVALFILFAAFMTGVRCSSDDTYIRGSNIFAHIALMIFATVALLYILISLLIWCPPTGKEARPAPRGPSGTSDSGSLSGTPRTRASPDAPETQ